MNILLAISSAFLVAAGISEGLSTQLGFAHFCFGIYIACDVVKRLS